MGSTRRAGWGSPSRRMKPWPVKLEFLYVPTRDLPAALALYRDELG
jgi:hypothetical protein